MANDDLKIKLLYLPNEVKVGDQVGPRHFFEKMHADGVLEEYINFSFLVEEHELGNEGALNKLLLLITQFRPNVIFWQHVSYFSIPDDYIARIRKINPQVIVAYHEGDVYGKFRKPIPKSVFKIVRNADICFLVGMGTFANRFLKAGCPRVVYSPHSVDTVRFGKEWVSTDNRLFDAIMIANRHKSRIPFMSLPGTKEREQLVIKLSKLLGDRFAVYGCGWNKFSAGKGPIEFAKQEEIIRQSWLSIGLDHFGYIPYYFSDRLPIALLSGVAHVCSYQPGLETMFEDGKHLVFFKSVDEAIEKIDCLLKQKKELLEIGKEGAKLALEKHTTDVRFQEILQEIISVMNQKRIGLNADRIFCNQ